MGHGGLKLGVQIIRKFVIRPTRICYRSVYNHPFLVGISLVLLFLYRSSPFLFSLLVSASPVLVCTAVLLGALLSFGEPSIAPVVEEDENVSSEIVECKTGRGESSTVIERAESFGKNSVYTELRREIVERSVDEEGLLDDADRVGKYETDDDLVVLSSVPSYHNSREIEFGEQLTREVKRDFEDAEGEQTVDWGNEKSRQGVEVGFSHEELGDNRLSASEKVQAEYFEDCKSVEGSVDVQTRNHLDSSMGYEEQLDELIGDSFSPAQEIQAENLVVHERAERSIDAQIRDHLESSMGSWTQFEDFKDRLSSAKKIQVESLEDYISAEGSVDVQVGSPLELSLGSWNQLDSDHDGDDESGTGSDGAESSSPDASMADIIPMLDELDPLLEDEIPLTSNLSRDGSATTMERLGKSLDCSIHSDDGSDEREEEEAEDLKSDVDDDNEEETQCGNEDQTKSAIMWTEDDQRNLMDLGTSELERNQRLESLIARRRARRMTERNLIDLDGMDLSFPVAPISTTRYNPFDNHHDSYADLGLPPIPGSAPSVLLARRNPFDLPYDSSEEKPDLTGDEFQEEFKELTQREASNQREAFFRRNETFSMGSSIFDFGRGRDTIRATRFRPYFVPERMDSDAMSFSSFQRQFSDLSESRASYSSLQRQSSELSESKASSAAETDSIFAGADQEENNLLEHEPDRGNSPQIDHAFDHVEHGSHSSDDIDSLLDGEDEAKDTNLNEPVLESSGVGNPLAVASHTSEAQRSAEMRLGENRSHLETKDELSDWGVSTNDIQLVTGLVEVNHIASSSPSAVKEYDEVLDEDVDRGSGKTQVFDFENVDLPFKYSLETSVSGIPTEHSYKESDVSHTTEADESHPKETVYDLSPLAMEKNLSSSSIFSDVQTEASEVDIYQIQRDLFAVEESKVHDDDAEDNAPQRRQDTDDSVLSMNEITENIGRGNTGLDFSELNQQSSSPLASSVAEYEVPLSKDFSDTGLVKSECLDEIASMNEVEQVLAQEDDAGVNHEGKLDANSSADGIPSTDVNKSSEDIILTPDEAKIGIGAEHVFPVQFKLSSSEAELEEDIEMEMEGDQHSEASVSNMTNHESDVNVKMFPTVDEPHYLSPESVIHDHAKLETSIIQRKVEEFDQVIEVCETANVLMVNEHQDNILSDPVRNEETTTQVDKFVKNSVAELPVEKDVHDISETGFAHTIEEYNNTSQELAEPVPDKLPLFEEENVFKEIDEELLSELDAVGDFSVADIGVNMTCSYLNDEVNSNDPVQVLAEVHSSSGMPFSHVTSLVDTTNVQNSESARGPTESNLAEFKESDSQTLEVHTGLLVLDTQSVEDIDFSSRIASEEEVQKTSVAESVQAEFPIKEAEATSLENELFLGATQLISRAAEVSSLTDTAFSNGEASPERSESDLASPDIEPYNRETNPEMSMNTEVFEQFGEDFEDVVESETNISNAVESPQTCKTEISSLESLLLQIDRDIKVIKESPLVRTNIEPFLQPGDQIGRVGFVESKSLQTNIEHQELQDSQVLDLTTSHGLESEHKIERVGSMGSEIMQRDRDVEETQELFVLEASNAPFIEFEDQIDGYCYVKSVSKAMDAETKEANESPVVEPSITSAPKYEDHIETDSLQGDLQTEKVDELPLVEPPVEASVALSEYDDQIQRVGSVYSEKLQMDRDVKEIHEPPVVEVRVVSASVFEDQIETGSLQDNLQAKEVNESLVVEPFVEASVPLAEYDDQIQRVGSVDSEKMQMDRDVKGIHEPPVVEVSVVSTSVFEDQREFNLLEQTVEVQNSRDHQVASEQRFEDGLLNRSDSREVYADSSITMPESTNEKIGVQGSKDGANSSQREKELLYESHLEFSSSSSSSSSSSNRDSAED